MPVVAFVVVMAVTLLWVRHNRGIYTRKGPRRAVPETETSWSLDRLGRQLHFGAGSERAAVVRLDLHGQVKYYGVDL